jgi:hypothetical protein
MAAQAVSLLSLNREELIVLGKQDWLTRNSLSGNKLFIFQCQRVVVMCFRSPRTG